MMSWLLAAALAGVVLGSASVLRRARPVSPAGLMVVLLGGQVALVLVGYGLSACLRLP